MKPTLSPRNRVVALYAAAAVIWIVGGDFVIALVTGGAMMDAMRDMAEDLLFVFATSAVLHQVLGHTSLGPAPESPDEVQGLGRRRVAAFTAVVVLIGAAAATLFWSMHQAQLATTNDALASIGRLKVELIERAISERLADLDMLRTPDGQENPLDARIATSGNYAIYAQPRIDAFRKRYGYASVNAYGAGGRLLLVSGAPWTPGSLMMSQAMARARTQGQAFLLDTADTPSAERYLDFALPLRDANGDVAAVLLARLDPRDELLPRVGEWPVPTRTGEAVIATTREGQVTYLTTTLLTPTQERTLQVSADLPELVARQAFNGARGLVRGRDYRGEPVLAWVGPVPGTPWMLVAKVDRSEAVGSTLRFAGVIAALALVAIVLAAAMFRNTWQRQVLAWSAQRLRDEAARVHAERQLELATRAASLGTFEWNIARNQLTWNEQHALLWNTTLAEFPGTFEAFASQVHPDDMPILTREIAARRADGKVFAMEFRVVRPEGGVRWIAARGRFFDDSPDKPGSMFGTVVDVSREHEEQDERMRLLGLLQSIIEGSTDAIYMKDTTGRYLVANAAALAAFGKPLAGVLGRTDLELMAPDDARQVLERDRAILADGNVTTVEQTIQVSTGMRTFLSTNGPTRDGLGRITGTYGISRDITERVRSAAAMAEAEANFRSLFMSNPVPMWVTDQQARRIVEVNDAAILQYGYSREEFLQIDIVALRPEDERQRFLEHIRSLPPGIMEGGIWRHRRKDGRIINVSTRSHAVQWANRPSRLVQCMDVTEQERAARALAESESRYRLLFQDNPHPMWVFDAATLRVLAVNDMAVARYGYTREEFLGLSIMDLSPPEDVSRLQAHLATLAADASDSGSWRQRLKDGKVIDVSVAVHATDWDGVPARVILSVDVTAQRKAETALRDALQMLELTVEGGEIGTWDCEVQTGHTAYNSRWAAMLGYEPGEITQEASTWENLVHPEDLAMARSRLQACIAGETPAYESEHRLRHKDGHWVWVLSKGKVTMHDTGGRAVRMSGTHLDISRRKRTDAILAEERAQLRGVVDQTIVGMYVIQDGKMVFGNQRYAEILGYDDPAQITGMEMTSLIAPECRELAMENIRKRMAGEARSLAYELVLLRRDGSRVDVGVHGSAATWRGRPAIIGVLQDISDKKRAEAAIQRYIKQIEDAFLRTVEVASALSEMRDPYTAGHERRVAELAVAIGRELGQDEHELEGLRVAGMLHDVGKILVPAEILAKPGKLSAVEYELVKGHVDGGWNVLKNVEFPWPVADMVRQHHERLDGTGYPLGLKGDQILPQSRIMAVADTVEAMSSHRPYRAGLGVEPALKEIERGRGTIYDPVVVDACLRLFREKSYAIPQ